MCTAGTLRRINAAGGWRHWSRQTLHMSIAFVPASSLWLLLLNIRRNRCDDQGWHPASISSGSARSWAGTHTT
jgi:hypothetical protein